MANGTGALRGWSRSLPVTGSRPYCETAWGQPQEFFEAVVKQFPHLDFTLDYEEEQGWGGEIYASKGVLDFHKKWDIPELIDVVAGL